jgi:hypothetical protein
MRDDYVTAHFAMKAAIQAGRLAEQTQDPQRRAELLIDSGANVTAAGIANPDSEYRDYFDKAAQTLVGRAKSILESQRN